MVINVVGLPCLCHIATICVYPVTLLQSTIPCAQNAHSLTAKKSSDLIQQDIPTEVLKNDWNLGLPSGKLTVCNGKIHHFFHGKTHYFYGHIFHSYV